MHEKGTADRKRTVDGIKVVCMLGMGEKKATGWESRFAARSKEALFAGLGWVPGAWSEEPDRVVRRLMNSPRGAVRMTWEVWRATSAHGS